MRVRTLVWLLVVWLLLLPWAALAKEAKAEFKVTGMSCGACAKGVEARLNDLNGVKSATVSFKEGTATIIYDDTKVSAEELKKTIEKSGFKAEAKPGKGNGKSCCP